MFVGAEYRLPSGLDVGESDPDPYGAAGHAGYGLFSTENALLPETPAWNLGFQYRYERYRYFDGKENQVKGSQTVVPMTMARNDGNWSFALTVPTQKWETTTAAGNKPYVRLQGIHDVELRAVRRIWEKEDGSAAVTAHLAGRTPGGNYDTPFRDFTGKTRTGVSVGPAGATRGGWLQTGGAYSHRINGSWISHLNLAYAYDAQDRLARLIYGSALDYRVGQNLALTGQVNGTSWTATKGPDGTALDLLLGAVVFNERWKASFGVPVSLQHTWNFGHDIGFTGGLSTTWE